MPAVKVRLARVVAPDVQVLVVVPCRADEVEVAIAVEVGELGADVAFLARVNGMPGAASGAVAFLDPRRGDRAFVFVRAAVRVAILPPLHLCPPRRTA